MRAHPSSGRFTRLPHGILSQDPRGGEDGDGEEHGKGADGLPDGWTESVVLDAALGHQGAFDEVVEAGQLVVKTSARGTGSPPSHGAFGDDLLFSRGLALGRLAPLPRS